MINIVVVHENKQERERIVSFLSVQREINILASEKNGYDAFKIVTRAKPDIVIMGNQLDNRQEIVPLFKSRSPLTAIVLLITTISDLQLYRAISDNISGFVCQEKDFYTLPEIIKCVFEKKGFISPCFCSRFLRLFIEEIKSGNFSPDDSAKMPGIRRREKQSPKADFPFGKDLAVSLNKRERSILIQTGEGYTNKEIAKNLGLAVGTVRNYISAVLHKTGLRNRNEMVRYACQHTLVQKKPARF